MKHDLNLPAWGPYGKKYLGLSHIADPKRGIRFDVDLFFGQYRRKVLIPDLLEDCGVKPWQCTPDLKNYTFRYELEWKDMVYCDASFLEQGEDGRLIQCEFVNNTSLPQSLNLNLFFSIDYPHLHRTHENSLQSFEVHKDASAVWIDALDYTNISCSCDLAVDGLYRGEVRADGFTGASGIGAQFFGTQKGDFLEYNLPEGAYDQLLIRYRSFLPWQGVLTVDGQPSKITLPPTDVFSTISFPWKGGRVLRLTSCGDGGVDIDGFALCPAGSNIAFSPAPQNCRPQIAQNGQNLSLSYPGLAHSYTIRWKESSYQIRQFEGLDLNTMVVNSIHDHVSETIRGRGEGHYTNLFLRPILLEPHSKKVINVTISTADRLGGGGLVTPKRDHTAMTVGQADNPSSTSAGYAPFRFDYNEAGQPFAFSQQKMAAVSLMNVVYPIYCRRNFIRHNTPGKLWDSLYTWDSGFIGMGLSALDTHRAEDCLAAYLVEPGDTHSPFIFHGSVVPTQVFLYLQLWNKTGSVDFLKKYYPSMKYYYDFFSQLRYGKEQMKSGLIKTWHIFYNSGGWDDYPAQKYVHDHAMEDRAAPVITSAVTVLCARILKMVAEKLGEDTAQYDADIAFYSKAIQDYAWDSDAGYFGYVEHDANGEPAGILRDDRGSNLNMGMDGVYPMIAGIVSEEQEKVLLKHVKQDLVTPYGVGTVAHNAPYYRIDGYWNGSVWMPHQWVLWKSMLDHGELEFANRIASTALSLWKREVDETYNCYEHFIAQNGRGCGYHQFSGLSTPVLLWFSAYYVKGNISAGFLTWVDEVIWEEDKRHVSFSYRNHCRENQTPVLLVCLDDSQDYRVKLNGRDTAFITVHQGTLAVPLSKPSGLIEITSAVLAR